MDYLRLIDVYAWKITNSWLIDQSCNTSTHTSSHQIWQTCQARGKRLEQTNAARATMVWEKLVIVREEESQL